LFVTFHPIHEGTKRSVPVALCLELVVCPSGLQQRLVDSPTARDDPNRPPGIALHRLLRAAGQSDPRLVLLGTMSDDGRVVPRRPGKRPTVSDLLLDVADDRALGHVGEGENVPDGERRFLAAVDKGPRVQTFGCDEGLRTELVAVRVTEDDPS